MGMNFRLDGMIIISEQELYAIHKIGRHDSCNYTTDFYESGGFLTSCYQRKLNPAAKSYRFNWTSL